ncbi:hypothetical protein K1719_036855 [Acacia pycnantha]|nr:hypothetical protein K1719_036855 [Acacia pycnantha]
MRMDYIRALSEFSRRSSFSILSKVECFLRMEDGPTHIHVFVHVFHDISWTNDVLIALAEKISESLDWKGKITVQMKQV